jgi:hypothetical protein
VKARDPAVQNELPSRAWHKQDQGSPSYFVPLGNRRWVEVGESGGTFAFEEINSTGAMVELLDPGRQLRIRLRSEYAELAVGDGEFRRWVSGRWIARSKLPGFARLASIDYRTRLIYFVPTDREPTREYQAKIRCLMTFVNSLYRYEFRRRGWDDRGLQFELDEDGQPLVHLIQGREPAAFYSGAPNYDANRQYTRIQPEIPAAIGSPTTHLIVAFLETYDAGPHHFEWPGGVALGAQFSPNGGLGIFSAWILRDEFCAVSVREQTKLFQDATPIEGRTALGHGRPNSPRFEFIEDGFGAVVHEVGHALGLPHDMRNDRHYIMANGFRQLRVNLAPETPLQSRTRFSDVNANFLRVSRHLNSSLDLDDNERPTLTLEPATAPSGSPAVAGPFVSLRLQAQDNRGLAAWRAFDPETGSILDGGELTGAIVDQSIQVAYPSSRPAPSRIEVTIIDTSGNTTSSTIVP